jgi:hypothetical protein
MIFREGKLALERDFREGRKSAQSVILEKEISAGA